MKRNNKQRNAYLQYATSFLSALGLAPIFVSHKTLAIYFYMLLFFLIIPSFFLDHLEHVHPIFSFDLIMNSENLTPKRPHVLNFVSHFLKKFFLFPVEYLVLTRKPPSHVFADLGSTIKLCCEAEASLVWSKAQTALTLVPSSQQNGCLILSNVNRESAGKYTCRASNDFGFADATTEVIVRGDAYTLMQSQIFPFLSHIKKKEKKETLQELLVYELQLIIAL